MKINTMKLKLTALLLVLYTGLYAQNKIVLTAPRLDTSSLSNRINLKANTSLNNVNGVLSSTYGGAGSVSGILKADGSGVVSPVIASDITTLISGTYLPLSGGTLSGALSGTSAAFSGDISANSRVLFQTSTSPNAAYQDGYNTTAGRYIYPKAGSLNDFTLYNSVGNVAISIPTGTVNTTLGGALNGTSAAFSGAGGVDAQKYTLGTYTAIGYTGLALQLGSTVGSQFTATDMYANGSFSSRFLSGKLLVNTTTESPNNEALQVAGSGLFSGGLTATSTTAGALTASITNNVTSASATTGYGLAINSEASASTSYALTVRNIAGSSTYMHILTETGKVGWVGFGTTNPTTPFHVASGAATFSSSVQASEGRFGTTAALTGLAGGIAVNSATSAGMAMRVSDVNKGFVYVSGSDVVMEGAASMNVKLLTTSGYYYNLAPSGLATSNAIRTLFNTTTDNGTDALQVSGSGLFSSTVRTTGIGISAAPNSGGAPAPLTFEDVTGLKVSFNGGALNHYSISKDAAISGGDGVFKLTAGNTSPGEFAFSSGGSNKLFIASTGAITANSSVTATSFVKSGGTSSQFLKADGSVDGSTYLTSAGVGNGTLTLNVSGSGLSGSQSFTANQSGNATFTVTSNATTAATASTIAYRDGSGNLTAVGFFESSDRRLKNIISRDGDVAYFKWKDGSDNKTHIGYIAQEVQKKNPDQVKADDKGFLSVNYTEVLVEKVRALEKKIEELEKRMK